MPSFPSVLEQVAAGLLRRLSQRLFRLAAKIRETRQYKEGAQMRKERDEARGFFCQSLPRDTSITAHAGPRVSVTPMQPTYTTAYLGLADLAREAVESGAFDAGKARELLGKIDSKSKNGGEMCRCGLEFFTGGLAKLEGSRKLGAAKSLRLLAMHLQIILRTVEREK